MVNLLAAGAEEANKAKLELEFSKV